MHLDDDAVRSGGDSGARHRRDDGAASGAMARIRDDWKVRELVHDRDRGEVEEVSRRRVETAKAALAEDHVRVALGEYVLGAEQEILYRGGHSALEQDRLPDLADRLEQRVVLHVARADLDAVGDLGDKMRSLVVHRFRDDGEARFALGERKQLESLASESLEGVGRAARLERTAAEGDRTGSLHRARGFQDLLLGLDGARAGDHRDLL